MRLWRLRSRLVLTMVAGLVAFTAVMSLSLAFGLSGTVSTDVENQTTLTEVADSAQEWICVEDGSAFTEGVSICIDSDADTSCGNAGDPEEEEKVVGGTPLGLCREGDEVPLTKPLDQVHEIDALVHTMPCVEVTPSPTPTSTPTSTPTLTPTRTLTIPAKGWANFAWTGDTVSPEELAHCFNDQKIAAMYRLDPETQMFERWFLSHDGLSTMGDVAPFDVLLALNASDEPATCMMPDLSPVAPRTLTIPAHSWGNFAWTGDTASPEEVAHCHNDQKIAVMYRLDAETQMFERWVRTHDALTTMGDVAPFDVLLAFNASDEPATCMMDGG